MIQYTRAVVHHCEFFLLLSLVQLDDCDSKYKDVSAILLDPSCSGSGSLAL